MTPNIMRIVRGMLLVFFSVSIIKSFVNTLIYIVNDRSRFYVQPPGRFPLGFSRVEMPAEGPEAGILVWNRKVNEKC